MSAPTLELIAELYAEEVREARRLSPDEKLRLGAELFDYACEITKSGIRHQNPGASEEEVLEILRARLALGERLEQSA